tara:strand:+ start:2064 stop:2282 length:219 start_codon:yes stop_codon:yes gene_type:complete
MYLSLVSEDEYGVPYETAEFHSVAEAQAYRDFIVDALEETTQRSRIHELEEELRKIEDVLVHEEDPMYWDAT